MTIANASAPTKRSSVSQVFSPTPVYVPTNFNYVTMLLHGDGTNGGQNNTFLDSSSNNFSVTRSGNPTQGTFTPYGANWSNYFDGSGDWLTTSTAATALNFGTGDFTVEFWINSNQTSRADPVGQDTSYTSAGWWGFVFNRSTSGTMEWFENANSRISATAAWNNGSWNHVAVCRSGNSVLMFLNGNQVGSTYTTSFSYGANSVGVIAGILSDDKSSGPLLGYISNLRIVKGTALYATTFTPSISPLTAISGTSLLTCADNRFIDDSSNNLTITTTGNTSVQRFSPFAPGAAYSTSTIGGSAYFDGSGDYLRTSSTVGIANNAFSICMWFYPLSSSVIGLFDSGPGVTNCFRNYAANTIEDQNTTGSVSFAGFYQVNAWNWMCITKSGSSFTVYINGTTVGTGTCSSVLTESNFTVGTINSGGDGSFNGYISDFQVLDSATNVSIPTSPIQNASGKTYLLNFQNGSIIDTSMSINAETVNNAQVSTAVKKYGTGSIAFDGTDDYVLVPSSTALDFNTGDFTVEAWVYFSSLTTSRLIFDRWATGNAGGWQLYWRSTGTSLTFYIGSAIVIQDSSTTRITTSTWYHIAVTRASGTVRLFVNGTLAGSATNTASLSSTLPLALGIQYTTLTNDLSGYIDDVRITKGLARYTSAFTAPTAAFEDI